MPDPGQARSVYRYFDLADSFVQILVPDAERLSIASRPGLNRQSYRRMVIETCMPEFRGDLDGALETLFPEDPLMVEDLLYDLCVEVNPALDIHEVRLAACPAEEPEVEPSPQASPPPVEDLLGHLRRRCRGLERRLGSEVFGQPAPVLSLVRAVRKAALGLAPEGRPLASFLFVGPTGTGKTELARCLARELFGGRRGAARGGLVRIDCSEYALGHEYSKLIGSPPGYVGHEDGGQLTDAVLEHPESVVLFDEIEKAHPRTHHLLLQVLEEGSLTDGKGREIDFGRTVLVMTSNAGAGEMRAAGRAVGFESSPRLGPRHLASIARDALERQFSPEFLGRIDETLLFSELDHETLVRVARKELYQLAERARGRGYRVAFAPGVARWVARCAGGPESGARELRRLVRQTVEPPLTERLLANPPGSGELLRVRVRDGALELAVEE